MYKESNNNNQETKLHKCFTLTETFCFGACLFFSDKYGYGADAWSLIENSGHSIFTVILIWSILNLVNTFEVCEETFSTEAKASISLLLAVGLELAPLIVHDLSSVVDYRDIGFIVLTAGASFIFEKMILYQEKYLLEKFR